MYKFKTLALRWLQFHPELILVSLLTITLLVCCSCGSTKVSTQLVREVSADTVYLTNQQYDSIYIYQDRFVDRTRDTLYVKDKSIEYRYKLLHDTVRVVHRDSIPYQVTITQVKEISRPLTWFDHLSRICFGICLSGLLILLYKFIKYFRSGGLLNH